MAVALTRAFGILSAVLLVFACLAIKEPDVAGPAIELSPAERDLGSIPLGEHEFSVTVVNRGNRPRQIVGISAACGQGCCYGPVVKSPVTVAAGESQSYPYRLAVKATGPFVAEITVYFEDGGVGEQKMTVRGVGRKPRDGQAVAASPSGAAGIP